MFQSTRPVRGATLAKMKAAMAKQFQSTRPRVNRHTRGDVSIHAPRAGRDYDG